jgi:methionyl-tRNA formyltransferase
MRVLFYGTPAFALPTLRGLLAAHAVVAVVTQPDRPAGRGHRPRPSAAKQLALAHGLPVLEPARLRDPGWADRLRAFRPDVAVVVAFGQILPSSVLGVPPRGSINVHASLLPRYRGAAPIAWAIIRGERRTGVTTFLMDEGLDTGPILCQEAVSIGPDETAGELAPRLAEVGGSLLLQTLAELDRLVPRPQDARLATLAPRLAKADGVLDWRRPARELVDRVRGLNPWPGASTQGPLGRLIIWRARAVPGGVVPGTLVVVDHGAAIGTGEGLLEPLEVQPENRRTMSWTSFLLGARLPAGTTFGASVAMA